MSIWKKVLAPAIVGSLVAVMAVGPAQATELPLSTNEAQSGATEIVDEGSSTQPLSSGTEDASEVESLGGVGTAGNVETSVLASKQITADQLCASGLNGLVTRSGTAVTVNLDKAGVKKLIIASAESGKESCLSGLQKLVITNSASSSLKEFQIMGYALGAGTWTSVTLPSNLDLFDIGNSAFYKSRGRSTLESVTFGSNIGATTIGTNAFLQQSRYDTQGLSSSLATVKFGSNMKKLDIGRSAFAQEVSGGGNNALKTVEFGKGMRDLTIGRRAFALESGDGGKNPLQTVYLPDGLKNVSIDNLSFMQDCKGDKWVSRNNLATVSLPGGMDSLSIGNSAFTRNSFGPEAVQPKLTFRTKSAPTTGVASITLGDNVTGYTGDWYWEGANSVLVAKAWEKQIESIGTPSYGNSYRLLGPVQIQAGTPKISGTAQVGSKLTADPGTWSPSGTSLSYQWLAGGTAISGATTKTYVPVASDKGKSISVKVTGKLTGASSVSKTSAAVVIKAAPVAPKPTPKPDRLAGANRYETNYQVNLKEMKAGKPVFVATGTAFPDALSVGPAVALTDGALVLAPAGGLSKNMVSLIKSKKPSAVYIIGGTGAVSESIAKQVGNAAGKQPQRVGGVNRYETSTKIMTEFFKNRSVSSAFIATGLDYPDALSAAAAGGTLKMPVLLVPGKNAQGKLQDSAVTFLKSKKAQKIVVVGGTGVVTDQVVNNVKKQGGFSATRLAGINRYGTNMAVNDFVNSGSGGVQSITGVWIATGQNFPDALSAGGPAGKAGQRLVLSNGSCIPKPVVSTWIKGQNSKVSSVNLVGGTGVLQPSVASLTECK